MKLSQRMKRKLFIISIGSVLTLSIAIFLGAKYDIAIISGVADVVTYPFKKGINVVGNQMQGVTDYFKKMEQLTRDNERLTLENDRLMYQNTILEQYKGENDQLKGLLDMQQRYKEYPSMGANIIAKDTGNWYKVFNIDKGKIQGASENDVILSGGGLVGHVVQVDPATSQVIAIIDDRSSVGAQVVRTGDIGVLKGDIELTNVGLCKMEIAIDSEVVKGDQIITSHLSDIYPPGIPIGIVEEVTKGKNGLTQYAYVKPFVDFKHLQNVLILNHEQEE
ncbi:MAG: rod shape-determining protein MreC [Cellulosilyticaceae bacterium]